MATSRVGQKIFCNGTKSKIFVSKSNFGHCELSNGFVTTGSISRTGNHRPSHLSLHASKSDQNIGITGANVGIREKQLIDNSVSKSLRTITGKIGAQVLKNAFKFSNNLVGWANNLSRTRNSIVDDESRGKSSRFFRRCRSCDPKHLKSEKVETKGRNASRFQEEDSTSFSVPNFRSAVKVIKRDNLNSSFSGVLSTQSHRGYSKLHGGVVSQEESGETAENLKLNENETPSIDNLHLNVEGTTNFDRKEIDSELLSTKEHARNRRALDVENKERNLRLKCHPMSRNVSFAFFQPLSNSHFFTTLSQCHSDSLLNLPLECPEIVLTSQYLRESQNIMGQTDRSRAFSPNIDNALVHKTKDISQKVLQIALLSYGQDLNKPETINTTILNRIICSCKSFLQPSLLTANMDGGKVAASKSFISKDMLPLYGEKKFIRIDSLKDICQTEEEKTSEENINSCKNDSVITVEGQVYNTSDETLNKLLLLLTQTKTSQKNCPESPILDHLLSPSTMLRKQADDKIDSVSSLVDSELLLSDMKSDPVSQVNIVASSTNNNLEFGADFFSEDLTGEAELENLKIKPPVSEKSIYKVLKAFKDIVREDTSNLINSQTYPSHTIENYVQVNESIDPSENGMVRSISQQFKSSESSKLTENESEKQFDDIKIDEKLINRLTPTVNLMQFGEHIGKSYQTFFQSIPQKNSELMLQCNCLMLHSFKANPNIRRASNLANSLDENAYSKILTDSQLHVSPQSKSRIMRTEHSSSRAGKQSKSKKPISSQALIKIFNENLNLKQKANDFSENIHWYDHRFDKFREVVISRDSSTYKSLLAGGSTLKRAPEENREQEAMLLPERNHNKDKARKQVVFKPRSVGAIVSSLDSNSAQSNTNNWNLNGGVTPENNFLKTVQREDGITRIRKLNKLSKRIASSTKKELRYSWRSNKKSLSSSAARKNKESISNVSGHKNVMKSVHIMSNSYLPVKSNHLNIFTPEKKRGIESLTGKENFDGRKQFGVLNFNTDNSKFSSDGSKADSFSVDSSLTKASSENNARNMYESKKGSLLDNNTDSTDKLSGSSKNQKSLIVEAEISKKENDLSEPEDSGKGKLAFDDKEQMNAFKLLKPINRGDKHSDDVTKLNTYARKLRHSIKYGSVFPDVDSNLLQMKPASSSVAVRNFRVANVIEKKTASNVRSSLIKNSQEGLNSSRFSLENNDTKNLVLQPDQVENIRERLMSDRSKMSELYKDPNQLDLNLLEKSTTQETEIKDEGSKYFSKLFNNGSSLDRGSGPNKKPFNKNNRKYATVENKVNIKNTIESKPLNLSSNNMKKYTSIEILRDNEKDQYAYKSERTKNENFNGTSRSIVGTNKISTIELMRSVTKIDEPSRPLSTEILVRSNPNEFSQENHIVPKYLVEKSKDNQKVLNQNNEVDRETADKDKRKSDEAHEKQMKESLSVYSSGKPQSMKLPREQKPFKTVPVFITERKDSIFGLEAKENNGGMSKNENKIEANKSRKETIFKVEEESKSTTTESARQFSAIESLIGSRSKEVQVKAAQKQKNDERLKYNRNYKFFSEKASTGPLEENSIRSLRDAVQKKSTMDAEFQQPSSESQSSALWLRNDNTQKIVENHNLKGSGYFMNNFKKHVGASMNSIFFKNNQQVKTEGMKPGTSAVHKSNTSKADTLNSHSKDNLEVVSPIKSMNSSNDDSNTIPSYEKENEKISKQKESGKTHSTKLMGSASSLPQTNSLFKGILTKDRMDGEIRGLEARGLEYNKKKHSAEKTDKETQTMPIVEKSKSKTIQNDKVIESSDGYLSKSISDSTSKNVKIPKDEVALTHPYHKRPNRTIHRNAVPPEETTNQEKTGKSNDSQSARYLDRNNSSSDSNGKDHKQTAFKPKMKGFKMMKVFADRKKESEKEKTIEIGKLNNHKELFRSPLSFSRLIQSKGL